MLYMKDVELASRLLTSSDVDELMDCMREEHSLREGRSASLQTSRKRRSSIGNENGELRHRANGSDQDLRATRTNASWV